MHTHTQWIVANIATGAVGAGLHQASDQMASSYEELVVNMVRNTCALRFSREKRVLLVL